MKAARLKDKIFPLSYELVPPGWPWLVPPHCEGGNAERAEKALLALWCFSSFGVATAQQLLPAVTQLCPSTDPISSQQGPHQPPPAATRGSEPLSPSSAAQTSAW